MRPTIVYPKAVAIALAVALGSAWPALAETVNLTASLDGAQQSPTLNIPGKGSAQLTFDTDTRKLDWTVEYSDLSGPPVMAHFHGPADKGQNADVAVPFEGDLASPIKGSATLTEAQAADLLAGKYYINLHTEAHKGGEIRGQVEKTM
ncbi:CHRD domain-containing protein [Arvimicrobium flavum]|uniref:CHRD domain-containing protein n=1 Tax=Arvimicrobium flavum TaxID=3393320 RepID=UPI00237B64AA|nr:CHRD domain-containing protein [Mesorhizobium shangrilense]